VIWTNRRLALALALVALASVVAGLMILAGRLLDPGAGAIHLQRDSGDPRAAVAAAARVRGGPGGLKSGFHGAGRGRGAGRCVPVRGGTITLEPVEQQLQVHVALEIDVDGLATGNAVFDRALRAALESGDFRWRSMSRRQMGGCRSLRSGSLHADR